MYCMTSKYGSRISEFEMLHSFLANKRLLSLALLLQFTTSVKTIQKLLNKENILIRAAISFFIIAIVAYIFGANGIAGLSVELGKTLLVVFLTLAAISFVASLLSGRRNPPLP